MSINSDVERPPYTPSIHNYDDANRKTEELIAKNNAAVSVAQLTGMPRSDTERAELVRILFDAILDVSKTTEKTTSQPYKYITSATRFPNEVVEVTCWKLLVS
jgi:hypothetical protein